MSRIQPVYSEEQLNPSDPWELGHEKQVYTVADCGKKRAIMRKGREYMTVSFFCGKWSCHRCGPYFKKRWIKHMVKVTEGKELYVTEIQVEDWGKVRKQIQRLKAD